MADKDDAEEQEAQTLEEIVGEVMGTPAEDDEAAKVEEKPEPDEEETPSEDDREALIARAKEAGFDDPTIEALGDGLEAALAKDDGRLINAFRTSEEPEAKEEPEPEKEPPAKKPDDYEPIEIDEEAVDPETLKVMRKLEAQNRKLADRLDRAERSEADKAEDEQRGVDEWYDSRFEELGSDWEDIFGVGDVDEVSRRHLRARHGVSAAVRALYTSYVQRGKAPPPTESLFERALLAMHPTKAIARAKAEDDEADQTARGKHAATGVARPSGRKAKPQTPNDEALAVVADWRRGKKAV